MPAVIYGNVRNDGLITNLPDGCTVEVPCLVDANGIQPTVIGDLPVHLAALMRTNVNVQEVTIAAALEAEAGACLSRRDARSAPRGGTDAGCRSGRSWTIFSPRTAT